MDMDANFDFLLHIGILLLAANIGGIISKKLKQPAVLGQILVGIFLGFGFLEKTQLIHDLSEIGVILLMFTAGLETDVNELKASGKSSTAIAITGVSVPMLMVSVVSYWITKDMVSSLMLGLIVTATSVSLTVQTLKELGQLKTKQGVAILGGAIIDDVIGIILLTVVIGMLRPSQESSVMIVIGKIFFFFVMTLLIGFVLLKVIHKIKRKGRVASYSLICCLFLAYLSEKMGVAAVTGAYFMGVIFSMTHYHNKITHDIQIISETVFTPIFFVGIGLGVQIDAIGDGFWFGMLIVFLAILGKIVGCGFGAKLTGFKGRQVLQIGIGMVPRAEVAIIIANLGFKMNFIGHKEFASAILLVVVTTLITPSLLKWAFKGKEVEEFSEVRDV
ncbi:cation:proton antiporter [Inediibacterium massiliense]|uniref:cation:proton antiporter n=1 Tax=Inediibacterium massiliense TaxID=1658111 RepID=UPI001FA78655|nr:cation:proton antiporter [Inediibacterium massiliense]